MGLDMYLSRKSYVKNWDHNKTKYAVSVLANGLPVPTIKPNRVTYITEEVGYWRKSNAIHGWFVRNVQKGVDDCGLYEVEDDKLKELYDLVLHINNMEPGEERDAYVMEHLPPTEGFFFGSYSVDEDYYRYEITATIEILKEVFEDIEATKGSPTCHFYEYGSSW